MKISTEKRAFPYITNPKSTFSRRNLHKNYVFFTIHSLFISFLPKKFLERGTFCAALSSRLEYIGESAGAQYLSLPPVNSPPPDDFAALCAERCSGSEAGSE